MLLSAWINLQYLRESPSLTLSWTFSLGMQMNQCRRVSCQKVRRSYKRGKWVRMEFSFDASAEERKSITH